MNKKTKGNAFLYIGGAITLVMTVLILVGLVWTPYSPTEMDPSAMTCPPLPGPPAGHRQLRPGHF